MENTNTFRLNVVIGIIGFIMMLVGFLCYYKNYNEVSTALTGIGGSVFATALVNLILTRNLGNIPLIMEALAKKIEFVRTAHEAELTFTLHDDLVRLEKRHCYNLHNPRFITRHHLISMFTDASPVKDIHPSGFVLVLEPDGTKLEGQALAEYVALENGKQVFRKSYKLQPGNKNAFEFRSVDYYRLVDRMTWTVQDLSEDLRVRIKNQTGRNDQRGWNGAPTVKINHHSEPEINSQMKHIDESKEIFFEFNDDILPYQGFEIMWDFSK